MSLRSDTEDGIDEVLAPEWSVREGIVVPETSDIVLRNGAVCLDATYLYADMADSTGLAQGYQDWAVAKVIRCYLDAATRLIRARGGHIRSFDGDRVMGIFMGISKNSDAAKAALNISWAVDEIINQRLKEKWSTFGWTMRHGIGIDTGRAMLVRGGVHGDNDIVSVGAAPNVAAKLSDKRGTGRVIHITRAVYERLSDASKYASGVDIWPQLGEESFGGAWVAYHGTSYRWEP